MKGVVVIDTNLMVLLIVGSASRSYISRHKRLDGYTADDFDMLGLIIAEFSEIILLPHILAEVSNIIRQTGGQMDYPTRTEIHGKLRTLIMTCAELPIPSMNGARREECDRLGLTDAMILHFCTMHMNGIAPTLLTVDSDLADSAYSLGYGVIDYKREFLSS